jgi:RNase P subunit RPR2
MAWFSWEAAPPGIFQDVQLSYLSSEVADQLLALYVQLGSDVGPPWGLLIGNRSGADAAWTLALHGAQQGWRAAVVSCGSLRIYPWQEQESAAVDEKREVVEKAAAADICVVVDLRGPPDPDDPFDGGSDQLLDLLLVRRRREPGLTLVTSGATEAEARQRMEGVHPGLWEQVERYRGLTVVQVPDEPQIPGSPAEMRYVELELETDDPALMALCRAYWAADDEGEYRYTVKELAERYGVASHAVSKTVTAASTARLRDRYCPSCYTGEFVTSRQDAAQRLRLRIPARECKSCEQERRESMEQTKQERFAITDSDPLDIEQLTLAEACTLLALIRPPTGETLARTIPLASWASPFAVTDDMRVEWVRNLFNKGILRIHPDSAMDAFDWEDDEPVRFYIPKVSYYVTGSGDTGVRTRRAVDALTATFRDGPWPEAWISEWPQVWRELAVAECVAYLLLCLGEHDLPFKAGEKTIAVLEDTLETFAIGQAYMFIWRAARDAAAYMVRERIPAARAANSTVGNIQRAMERARAEGWDIKAYNRDWRLPVSAVSHTFFTVAMQVPNFMSIRFRDVSLPKAAEPPPVAPVVEEELPAGAVISPDGTVYVSPQPQRRAVTISRNAPCPCGSGKKFKRCCGAPQATK